MSVSRKIIQYPAQTGAYKVFVKDKGLWQKHSHARLHISIGNPKHDGEKFRALAEWAEARFERVTLIISDTLQRHNIALKTGKSLDEARSISLHMGTQWLARNLESIELLSNANLSWWDNWLNHPEYEATYNALLEMYATDKNLRDLIRKKAIDFSKRDSREERISFSLATTSITYIIEEIAVFGLMFQKDRGINVYPGEWFKEIFEAIAERNTSPLLQNFQTAECQRIDFLKNRQFGNENSGLEALAEGMKISRDKTRQAVKHLKQYRRVHQSSFAYMPRWEEPALMKEVNDTFARYMRFYKGYYALRRKKEAA